MDFEKIYPSSKITPYIHILGEHIWQMIEKHGDVSLFTMQGLERLNDLTTKDFFSSTNKHSDYLNQLLKKRNRQDSYNLVTYLESLSASADDNDDDDDDEFDKDDDEFDNDDDDFN